MWGQAKQQDLPDRGVSPSEDGGSNRFEEPRSPSHVGQITGFPGTTQYPRGSDTRAGPEVTDF